jgi:predicted AlkP superfamily phosphohydrolase/phosphomutase
MGVTIRSMKTRIIIFLVFIAASISANCKTPSDPVPETNYIDISDISNIVSSNNEKLLIIGVDSFNWAIAVELMNNGKLPNIARLLKEGTHGTMQSEAPLISPAIWTTISTGHSRKVHGIDDFFTKLTGSYDEVRQTSKFRKVPAIWEIAGFCGRTVGVVNWNAAYPAEEVNGVFVAFGSNIKHLSAEYVYPLEWHEKISSIVNVSSDFMETELEPMNETQARMAYETDRFIYSAANAILHEERPDLMMVYFPGVDIVSHIYWKYRWPISLDHRFNISKSGRENYLKVIENQYIFTDIMIGGLVEKAKGYKIMIVSDHGMGPNYPPANYYITLNNLLESLGYLEYEGQTCETILSELTDLGAVKIASPRHANIYTTCRSLEKNLSGDQVAEKKKVGPSQIEENLRANNLWAPLDGETNKVLFEKLSLLASFINGPPTEKKINWQNTKAWNVRDMKKNEQGIFINLEGREKSGIVSQSEYDSIVNEVIKTLASLMTNKGELLFSSVKVNDEKVNIKNGQLADVPDILVEVNKKALFGPLVMKGPEDHDPIPVEAIRWVYSSGSGDHRPEGVFLLYGPGIESGEKVDASIYDVAPTALSILGIPPGNDMKGRVLSGQFSTQNDGQKPQKIDSWSKHIQKGEKNILFKADEAHMKQLKALGYIQN